MSSVKEACNICTGKLDANQGDPEGQYPFFTCAPEPLKIDKYAFNCDAILLAGNNAQGNFHIQRYSGKFNAYQRTYVLTAKDGFDIDYVKYSLEIALSHFKRLAQGSQTKFLTIDMIENFSIGDKKLEEQKTIVRVLKSLDDKILLNKKVNDNLQHQAQLLFDFMFKDVTGPKHIGDFIVPQRGTALLSKDAIPGNVPVIAGGLEPSTYHNAANTVSPVITISSSGANAGFVNLWGVPIWSSDSSFIDFKMTPYVYFWYALLKRYQNNIYNIQTGSAQPHIYPSHIANLPICDLDHQKVVEYTRRVTPWFSIIAKNYRENNQMQATRDWLLPMLMNGQASIED